MTTPVGIAVASATYRRRLLCIVIVGFLARCFILIAAEKFPGQFDFPDSHRYVRVAKNIAAGHGPIDSPKLRSGTDPLYPLILAIGPRIGMQSIQAIFRFGRISNALFSLASILLLAAIGRRLFDDRTALFGAALMALDPILLFFNALVLTESLYIFLLLAAFDCITRIICPMRAGNSTVGGPTGPRAGTSPTAWALGAGVCMGLGTLARSTNLFLPLFVAPILYILISSGSKPKANQFHIPVSLPEVAPDRTLALASNQRRRTRAPSRGTIVAMFLFATYFTMSPVFIRNFGIYGRFVPVRIGGGASLLEGLGPWADGAPGMDRIEYPEYPPNADELERDRINRATAIEWARQNPAATLRLAVTKLRRTWSIVIQAAGYQSPLLRAVCWLTVAPVFALALGGFLRLRRRPALAALLLAPAVYFTLVHMIFVGSVRYRLPAMPFLFLLAALALGGMLASRRSAPLRPRES